MTRIDMINKMLQGMGEPPISSISDNPYGAMANSILESTSTEVQSGGWWFNLETVELTPNYSDPGTATGYGTIQISPNVITVTGKGSDVLEARGTFVYNVTQSTYEFADPIEAEITYRLPLEELPVIMGVYITAKAARKFQQNFLGSTTFDKFLAEEEQQGYWHAVSEDTAKNPRSMTDSNYQSLMMKTRRGNPLSYGR